MDNCTEIKLKYKINANSLSKYNIIGFPNLKNTCYLNAVLQIIKRIFLKIKIKYGLNSTFQIFEKLFTSKNQIDVKNKLKSLYKELKYLFDEYEEGYDVSATYITLINYLFPSEQETSINNCNSMTIDNKSLNKLNELFIQENIQNCIFNGSVINVFKCEVCGKSLIVKEIFSTINLSKINEKNKIQDLIDNYFKQEKIDNFFCEVCNTDKEIINYKIINLYPKILAISLSPNNYIINEKENNDSVQISQEILLNGSYFYYLLGHINYYNNKEHVTTILYYKNCSIAFEIDDKKVYQIGNRNHNNDRKDNNCIMLFYIKKD
jgi:ubiquitin C-terminal hydrolase